MLKEDELASHQSCPKTKWAVLRSNEFLWLGCARGFGWPFGGMLYHGLRIKRGLEVLFMRISNSIHKDEC